jgi:hypothetical protein
LQVACGETFGETAVNRLQQLAGFRNAVLISQQPSETRRGS